MNWLLKSFSGILSNQTVLLGLVCLVSIIMIIFIAFISTKPAYEVHYFSPDERSGEEISVKEQHPNHLKTSDNKKFLRFRGAYQIKRGMKKVTVWLAKRGTAYTFQLESTPENTSVKVGSLWDGVVSVLGDDIIKKLKDDVVLPLKASLLFVTVDLESGFTPEGYEPLSEESVLDEADESMAGLIGKRIHDELKKEDWVKNVGLIGIGVALTYVIQAMGIMKGFA